jgi:hypothetical protein
MGRMATDIAALHITKSIGEVGGYFGACFLGEFGVNGPVDAADEGDCGAEPHHHKNVRVKPCPTIISGLGQPWFLEDAGEAEHRFESFLELG